MRISVQREEQSREQQAANAIRSRALAWPDSVALREAIQNPAINISDSELKKAQVSQNRQGLPIAYTGRFAVVFRLVTVQGEQWAFRCFTHPPEQGGTIDGERSARYQLIAHHLSKFDDLFVPYRYLPEGIRVGQTWYPAIAMRWASGETLGRFVERNLTEPETLRRLAGSLSDVLLRLEAAGLAHGDWQHDNLMVSEEGGVVTLVDYDGMYVPELEGLPAPEFGHANYQHPRRTAAHYSVGLDRFACLVIQTALLALAYDPNLWQRFSDGDSLLFRQSDLADPGRSPLFHALRAVVTRTQDEVLADTLARLEDACLNDPLSALPPAVAALAPKREPGKRAAQWKGTRSVSVARPSSTKQTSGKWWSSGAEEIVAPASAATKRVASSQNTGASAASGATLGVTTDANVPSKSVKAAKGTAKTASKASAGLTPYTFLEQLTETETDGSELRHLRQMRAVAVALLVAMVATILVTRQAPGLWFLVWFAGFQMFNGSTSLYRRWPRRVIAEQLDAEIAKMDHAIRERNTRLMSPAPQSATPRTPVEEFITAELGKTPIYRVLNVNGIDVTVLNKLHAEGIGTALDLRGRKAVYGVNAHELSALNSWIDTLALEAASLYKQRFPNAKRVEANGTIETLNGLSKTETTRLEQEIAEFERERERLEQERDKFPDTSPGAYIARLLGRE